jgi:CDK inhibitor PHO81
VSDIRQVLPQEFGVSIDLAYPLSLRSQPDLNTFADSILRTIYQVLAPSEALSTRRRVAFTSFSPDVCAFLNWKQPNCKQDPTTYLVFSSLTKSDPVFFYPSCGKNAGFTNCSVRDESDDRSASLSAAAEFAKSNNLLGLVVDATLLVRHSPG